MQEKNYGMQEKNYAMQGKNYVMQEKNYAMQEKNYVMQEKKYAMQERNYNDLEKDWLVFTTNKKRAVFTARFLYYLKCDYAFPAAIKFNAEPATNQPICPSL